MQNMAVNVAVDLSPATRAAIEDMLGRALGDDEQISVMAFRPPRRTGRERPRRGSFAAEIGDGRTYKQGCPRGSAGLRRRAAPLCIPRQATRRIGAWVGREMLISRLQEKGSPGTFTQKT
jgi:hypothetical protein